MSVAGLPLSRLAFAWLARFLVATAIGGLRRLAAGRFRLVARFAVARFGIGLFVVRSLGVGRFGLARLFVFLLRVLLGPQVPGQLVGFFGELGLAFGDLLHIAFASRFALQLLLLLDQLVDALNVLLNSFLFRLQAFRAVFAQQ